MSAVAIPRRAYDAAHEAACRLSGPSDDPTLTGAIIDAAAPIIVAAELRRQAESVLTLPSGAAVALPSVIAGDLLRRADELDPPTAIR